MRKTDASQQGTELGVSFSSRRGTREEGPTRIPLPCTALQPVTRLHSPSVLPHPRVPPLCLPSSRSMGCYSSQHTAGDQLAKGANQTKSVLHFHLLLDQGLEQVLPGRLLMRLLDASARKQPAPLLKGARYNLPRSTEGMNCKVRVVGFFCMFLHFRGKRLILYAGQYSSKTGEKRSLLTGVEPQTKRGCIIWLLNKLQKTVLKGFDEVLNGLEHTKDITHRSDINPSLLPNTYMQMASSQY